MKESERRIAWVIGFRKRALQTKYDDTPNAEISLSGYANNSIAA